MQFPKVPTGTLAVSGPARARRDEREYRPFPNESGRNTRQVAIEVPLMVGALGLPTGGRVLEVGCGRGVALPVLARLLRPARLAGLDLDPALLDEARAAGRGGVKGERGGCAAPLPRGVAFGADSTRLSELGFQPH